MGWCTMRAVSESCCTAGNQVHVSRCHHSAITGTCTFSSCTLCRWRLSRRRARQGRHAWRPFQEHLVHGHGAALLLPVGVFVAPRRGDCREEHREQRREQRLNTLRGARHAELSACRQATVSERQAITTNPPRAPRRGGGSGNVAAARVALSDYACVFVTDDRLRDVITGWSCSEC